MRHTFLQFCLFFSPLSSGAAWPPEQARAKDIFLLTGTYTSGQSKGIYVYKLNTVTGATEPVSVAEGLKDPSFLAVAPDKKHVYAVSESKSSVYAFTFDAVTGKLILLNEQSVEGNGPCHITIDKSGKYAFAANYGGGSLSVLPILADGAVGKPVQLIQMRGSGVVASRQKEPHVHQSVFSPDGKQLFVSDLGTDKIMIYDFHPGAATPLTPSAQPFVSITPGGGPRHLVFHPDGKHAYVVHEISGHVTAFTYSKGKLAAFQTIATGTPDYKGDNFGSADIHITADGRFLYMSNRGDQNNIAVFSIEKSTGKLTLVGHEPTQGQGPRNFLIAPGGHILLVANQNGNNIVVFERDAVTGKLKDVGKTVSVPSPVCLQVIQ